MPALSNAPSTLLSEADIVAREADILGSPQRIAPLRQEEFTEEARALVVSVRESVGLKDHSKIPPVFGLMLKHPKLYRCQMDMGVQLFNGAIPVRERELAIMRVGWLCRAPYEWGQHVIIAKRYGITTDEVDRVTHGSSASGWNAHEAAILRGVEELIGNQMISDATWNTLAATWNDQQLIEFPTLVGQYVATAYSQNALRIALSENNVGLRQR